MFKKSEIARKTGEKGFTLIETVLVVGLSTLIAVGVIAGLLEGLDTLNNIVDTQSIEFSHQRAMNAFMEDIQSAKWFYNGTVHDESGGEVLQPTTNPFILILGYPGPNSEEIWVRYSVRYGSFTRESYLMRTVLTSTGAGDGSSILASGVANLGFNFYGEDGNFTDQLPDVRRVAMTLSINIGGPTVQRIYDYALRNPNDGLRVPPGDFDSFEEVHFKK
jgi:type II secretory pathway pseudopilin PulG